MSEKWLGYYDKGVLPWDSGRPSSQLVSYICSCITPAAADAVSDLVYEATDAPVLLPNELNSDWLEQPAAVHTCEQCKSCKPPASGSILELGCGTGASSVWLAKQGFQVMAIDIVQAALDAAATTAAAAGLSPSNPYFKHQDIMLLNPNAWGQQHDMIYDCQVYHALVKDDSSAQQKLPQLLFDLVKPQGLLFLLTGNANEPEIGPAVLAGQQLLEPLLLVGFKCVFLRQTRFDSTKYYVEQLKKRPLAWWAILQKPAQG